MIESSVLFFDFSKLKEHSLKNTQNLNKEEKAYQKRKYHGLSNYSPFCLNL